MVVDLPDDLVLPETEPSDLPLRWPGDHHLGQEQTERRVAALFQDQPLTPQAVLDITRYALQLNNPAWARRWMRFVYPQVRARLDNNVSAVRLARALLDLAVQHLPS